MVIESSRERLLTLHDLADMLQLSYSHLCGKRTGVLASLVARGMRPIKRGRRVVFDAENVRQVIAECASKGVALWEGKHEKDDSVAHV